MNGLTLGEIHLLAIGRADEELQKKVKAIADAEAKAKSGKVEKAATAKK